MRIRNTGKIWMSKISRHTPFKFIDKCIYICTLISVIDVDDNPLGVAGLVPIRDENSIVTTSKGVTYRPSVLVKARRSRVDANPPPLDIVDPLLVNCGLSSSLRQPEESREANKLLPRRNVPAVVVEDFVLRDTVAAKDIIGNNNQIQIFELLQHGHDTVLTNNVPADAPADDAGEGTSQGPLTSATSEVIIPPVAAKASKKRVYPPKKSAANRKTIREECNSSMLDFYQAEKRYRRNVCIMELIKFKEETLSAKALASAREQEAAYWYQRNVDEAALRRGVGILPPQLPVQPVFVVPKSLPAEEILLLCDPEDILGNDSDENNRKCEHNMRSFTYFLCIFASEVCKNSYKIPQLRAAVALKSGSFLKLSKMFSRKKVWRFL